MAKLSFKNSLKNSLGMGSEDSSQVDFLAKKASHLYIGYFSGTEKEVKSSVMEFIQTYVRDNELSKSGVYFNVEQISGHPYFDDGFVFEIHEGGDGLSYIELVMKAFAEKVKIQTIPLLNGRSVSLQKKPGNIDAYLNASEDMAGDVNFIDIQGRKKPIKRLFKDNYLFFYVALVLTILGALSIAMAMIFKFVVYNETKVYETQGNVGFVSSMPDKTIQEARSTDTDKLTGIQYSKRKGWFLTMESRDFNTSEVEEFEVRIDKNGKKTEVRTKTSEDVKKKAGKGNSDDK
tara:strand:+ start:13853 stop:14722 length:870 start_codon:yes stop_codon:yes gene_type:complete